MIPRYRPPVAIRHHAVELPGVIAKDERQEMLVAVPEGQIEHAVNLHPFERSFDIPGVRFTPKPVDDEDEAEPVFAVGPEAGPIDRTSEPQRFALDPCLFADLATHAGDHVLAGVHFAAE